MRTATNYVVQTTLKNYDYHAHHDLHVAENKICEGGNASQMAKSLHVGEAVTNILILKLGNAEALFHASGGVHVLQLIKNRTLFDAGDKDLGVDAPFLEKLFGKTSIEKSFAEVDAGERLLEPIVELREAFERRSGSVDTVVAGVGF